MKKERSFYLSPGVTSLLGVFFIFCLIAFAILSYNTAKNDMVMAERAAAAIADYYTARAEGEETLSLAVAAWENKDQSGLAALGVKMTSSTDGDIFTFRVPMENKRMLNYEVLLKTDGSIVRNTLSIME